MQPIPQHARFTRAGNFAKQLSRTVAVLDLPEKLRFPTKQPIILAGNHRSFFDLLPALALFAKFGLSARILIRADLMESGPSAALLKGIGCIPTSRELRVQSEETAIETLNAGELICMMPEGRLVKPEDRTSGVGSARPGVSRIARATNAAVIPVAFAGSEIVWPRGSGPRFQRSRPRVTLRLGAPITFATDDHEANAADVMAAIAELLWSME